MIIGIDLDGVMRNFTEQFIRIYNRMGPEDGSLVPSGYETKYWNEKFDGKGAFKDQRLAHLVWDFHQYELMYRAPIIPEGLKMLTHLQKTKHELLFITHQYTTDAKKATIEWVKFYDLKLPVKFSHGNSKWKYCDFLIDDKPENCMKMSENNKQSFLINRPYNINYQGLKGTHDEAAKYIVSL